LDGVDNPLCGASPEDGVGPSREWAGTKSFGEHVRFQDQLEALLAGREVSHGAFSFDDTLEDWTKTPTFLLGQPLPSGVIDVALASARLDGLAIEVRLAASAPIESAILVFGGVDESGARSGRSIEVSDPVELGHGWWSSSARFPWYAYKPWEPITFGVRTTNDLGFETTLFAGPRGSGGSAAERED
jgi:hypothetical protein